MWLLHGRKKTKKVKGGQTLHQRCPDCGADATFHEVEITTSAGAFFVDVVSDTERAFACSVCGEVFDLRDTDSTSSSPSAPAAPRDMLVALRTDQERQEAHEAARDRKVDDELAELKRKLGKS